MPRNAKEKSNEVRLDSKISDFIPFACHYDNCTILTKNGELVQTIKIQSISSDTASIKDFAENLSHLRETVRKALFSSIKSDNYSLWFHTVRSRQDISVPGKYPDIFSDYVNNSWRKKHILDKRFSNEFYVTILYEGQLLSIKSIKELIFSLNFATQRKYRNNYLKKAHRELNESVNNLIIALKGYNTVRLEVEERDGVFYSAPMEFFSKIVNIADKEVVLDEYDISQKLSYNKISFGFNALEIEQNNKHNFATIFSVKEYNDISPHSIEALFSLPMQLVITETANFINNAKALEDYEYQKYILDVSRDNYFPELSGLNAILQSDKNQPTNFAEHQVTIMLVEENLSGLEREAKNLVSTLGSLGIVIVREDLMMEDCFWSQLPGNFAFIRRKFNIPSNFLAAFTSVDNSPIGNRENSWGNAVAVIPAADKTPYFFNFHGKDKYHSLFLGSEKGRKRRLLNFLLAESQKYTPRIYYLSKEHNSDIFLKAIGGKIWSAVASQGNIPLELNPLLLSDTPLNRNFIVKYLDYIFSEGKGLGAEDSTAVLELSARIFSLPAEQRNPGSLAAIIENSPLASYLPALSQWHGDGKYSAIFGNKDNVSLSARINGFNFEGLDEISSPIAEAYILHRIKNELNKQPSLVILDEILEFSKYGLIEPLPELLQSFKQKNANIIFSFNQLDIFSKYPGLTASIGSINTVVFLPHTDYSQEIQDLFALSDEDFSHIKSLQASKKILGVVQEGKLNILRFSIAELRDIAAILNSNDERRQLMEKTIMQMGNEVQKWLPAFIKKVV